MTWQASDPGVMALPSGRLIRGRAIRVAPASSPEWGLYLLARNPHVAWPAWWVNWRDFWVPDDEADAHQAIAEAWERSATQRVEIACGGGIGRTGTALAAMARLDGLEPGAALQWVRVRYHPRAVETPWQRRWLTR